MADEETFDIYGDDFGQNEFDDPGHEDLYSEILGEDSHTMKPKKEPTSSNPDVKKEPEQDSTPHDKDKQSGDNHEVHSHYEHDSHERSGHDHSDRHSMPRNKEDHHNFHSARSNASSALIIGELNWWVGEEDIRSVLGKSIEHSQLKEITFQEHKVNGKSKGVIYLEFSDVDVAKAAKECFETTDIDGKRCTVNFANPGTGNPFKILPKEPPPRAGRGAGPTRGNAMHGPGRGQPNRANFGAGGFRPSAPPNRDFFPNPMAQMGGFPGGNRGYGMGGGYGDGFDPWGMSQRGGMMRGRGNMMRGGFMGAGRGGPMHGGYPMMDENYGFPAPHINPAFFEQGGYGGGMNDESSNGSAGTKRRAQDDGHEGYTSQRGRSR
ncbi:hypothetical protein K493DRAFT_410803 [Basidiobolus meristosporus CBS 931.73]|uniref:RRM domain-containing protein n=1 Tax=Basidiobolus meristosporus CBS 931.73 TaxID=1314790 RepID=A0A1Y1XSY3_9FUNG|nr:hypothetical protein K493DRAFT_410803 [Basidiobolus meristosporus CBS 931.73]|eukprot:ORX88833.1 hypothetical protein K493DRAFT_410803 [Basidiobolus meristosporus CBS 931.73]